MKLLINLLLFLIALLLELVLMPINVSIVFVNDWKKGGFIYAKNGLANYFYESAFRKDKFLCAEYRSLWNATLKTKEGKKIGVNGRTLSADLGEQELNATMSRTGSVLNCLLFLIEKNHCRKAFLNKK